MDSDVLVSGIPRTIEHLLMRNDGHSQHILRDSNTKDANFRICPHPTKSGLFIATGGSLHAFKFLPTIGKYIVDLIENKLASEYKALWRWRFGEDPAPSSIDRHPYPKRDLVDLHGWQNEGDQWEVPAHKPKL